MATYKIQAAKIEDIIKNPKTAEYRDMILDIPDEDTAMVLRAELNKKNSGYYYRMAKA